MGFYYKPLDKIFVTGSYTTSDPVKMKAQKNMINDHVYTLTNTELYCVICPIVLYHDTYLTYGSKPHDFWLNINLSQLDSSIKELHVITSAEHDLLLEKIIKCAKELQIEIKYF